MKTPQMLVALVAAAVSFEVLPFLFHVCVRCTSWKKKSNEPNGPKWWAERLLAAWQNHSCELKMLVQCMEFLKVKRDKHLHSYTLPCLLLEKRPATTGEKAPQFRLSQIHINKIKQG